MRTILDQYKNAIRVTKVSPRQKKLFALASKAEVICFDTETTGIVFNSPSYYHTNKQDIKVSQPFPFGVSLAFEYKNRVVLSWADIRTNPILYDRLLALLKSNCPKTWHNARYDLRVLKENKISVGGDQHCTLTMSRLYWDRRKKHSLESLTEFLCPELCDLKEPTEKALSRLKAKYTRAGYSKDYVNFSFLPEKLMSRRAMTDSFMGLMLYKKLKPIMDSEFPELYERELKVMHVISKIEERGLAFDSRRAKRKAGQLSRQIKKSLDKMANMAGLDFNPNSSEQVLRALRELGIKDKQLKEKGKVTTGADKLREVLSEGTNGKRVSDFIGNLLNHRACTKIRNTYLLPLAEKAELNNGIVYTSINPTDTRTGRPASRDPNLLNIPVPISKKTGESNPVRECFVCRRGHCVYYFDVSQQEMAVFGLYANDLRILDAYASGEDLHQYMAEQIGLPRVVTKNVNFGVIYGMGIRTMATKYGMSQQEAKDNMNIYLREFPSVREFQNKCKEELQYAGCVEDFFGRRYSVPIGQAYKAVNCLVQGGCAQAFKIGLLNVSSSLDNNEHILLLPYDEIQIEKPICSKEAEKSFVNRVCSQMVAIPQLLERGLELRVDVSKSITNWAEKEKLET